MTAALALGLDRNTALDFCQGKRFTSPALCVGEGKNTMWHVNHTVENIGQDDILWLMFTFRSQYWEQEVWASLPSPSALPRTTLLKCMTPPLRIPTANRSESQDLNQWPSLPRSKKVGCMLVTRSTYSIVVLHLISTKLIQKLQFTNHNLSCKSQVIWTSYLFTLFSHCCFIIVSCH